MPHSVIQLTDSFKLPGESLRADNSLAIVALTSSLIRTLVGGRDRSLWSFSSLSDDDKFGGNCENNNNTTTGD